MAHAAADAHKAARLTGVVRALCHPYVGDESRHYVKMASTCTVQLELFGHCFPQTPAIFLYRDPVEVMVAAIEEGGCDWMRAKRHPALAHRLTGIAPSVVASIGVEEYAARVIERYYGIVARYQGALLPINYARLLKPETVEAICHHFAVPDPRSTARQMLAVSGKNAKRRGDYASDSERRRRKASQEIADAAERWCAEAYQRLDVLSAQRLRRSER